MANIPDDDLQAQIAEVWMKIREAFGDDVEAWRTFSAELLALLRQLDEPADRAVITEKIAKLLRGSPAANLALHLPALNSPRSRSAAPKSGGLQSPWATPSKPATPEASISVSSPASAPAESSPTRAATAVPPAPPSRHVKINVLFGTDRVPDERKDNRAQFKSEGGDSLSFGVATVSIPDRDTHIKGRLERPRWYRLEFRENPDKHVMIMSLEQLDEDAFTARAKSARSTDGSSDEALIFVHGFNVSFDDSIRRTAQFAADLEFGGIAIAYSWPSKGSVFGYPTDANISESSMFRLADFIKLVRTKLGLSRVHIVAHSMGNRVLARALNQHVLSDKGLVGATLNQMVFAAPDIDPKTFGGFAKVFAASCERCTLYASKRDLALAASGWLYARDRAGASASVISQYGVDAIDASKVDDSMLGHSYFSDKRVLLQDLSELLFSGRAPGERYGLSKISIDDRTFWQFDA